MTTKRKRGQNEGSIFKPKDRSGWAGVIPAKYHPTGRRHRIYAKTREEVSKRLAEAISGKSVPQAYGRDTLAAWLDRWLESINVAPATWESYFYACKHITKELGNQRIQALQPSGVQGFLGKLRRAGKSARTVAYARTVLHRALTMAMREGLVSRNVASVEYLDTMKRKETAIEPLNQEQAKAYVQGLKPGEYHLLLAITLGLRRGELLGLRWQDIDFDAKTIRIVQAVQRTRGELRIVQPKNLSSRRILRAPDTILEVLQRHRADQGRRRLKLGDKWQDHGLVFPSRYGTPMEPRNALRKHHQVIKRLGLPSVTIHALRHTAATVLLILGERLEIVSKILGHSSIAITHKIYAHYSLSQQDGAAAKVDEMMRG